MTTIEISAKATTATDGTYAPCAGLNHRDSGEIVLHDMCGQQVAKREDGALFTVRPFGTYGARKYTCWSDLHKCDPAIVALVERERATAAASGQIVKGGTARVVKGRKVPVGTEGKVIWTGIDSYGKARLGIRDAAGITHWTAESNCKAI